MPAAPLLAWVLTTAAPRIGGAQAAPDSAARTRHLAGSARIAIDASSERLDNGIIKQYTLSPAAYPFVGEHLQLGLAPNISVAAGPDQPTNRAYGAAGVVNYVVGRGARWRGYVGGYAATATSHTDPFTSSDPVVGTRSFPSYSRTDRTTGLQAGVLYFLDPAVGLRAGVNYRASTAVPFRNGALTTFVSLDPYLFGRADNEAPAAAGFGVVDVAADAQRYDVPVARYHQWGGSLLVAPYVTRWAQLGVTANGFRYSDFAGGGAYVARAFGRLYLPLTARTQPYAEAFAQTGTYDDIEDGRLTGGTLGVRRMLNARVALDVGLQRRVLPRQFFPDGVAYRAPGQTGFVVGLATRVGRARGAA